MTTQTQEIIEAVTPVSDKLLQYMTATEELLSKYGGDVANLALTVLRIEAAGQLLVGIIGLVSLYFFGKQTYKAITEYEWSVPTIQNTVGGLLPCFCMAISLAYVGNILNIWNWVGLFWPEAYAVHKFILS